MPALLAAVALHGAEPAGPVTPHQKLVREISQELIDISKPSPLSRAAPGRGNGGRESRGGEVARRAR